VVSRGCLLVGAALLLSVFGAAAHLGIRPATAQQAACGTNRWDIKTLTDPSVGDIDLTQVISVNISTLAALPLPDTVPASSRYDPYETTVYTISGELVQASLQPDHDIVLELEDPDTGDTITAAIPDAAQCATGASPQLVHLMEQARQAFVQGYGLPSPGSPMPLSGTAAVVGVGFLDPVLGQDGEASNGMELHPVLDFEPQGASGSGGQTAGGPATATATVSPTPSSAGSPQHDYYVDAKSNQPLIYCASDPALVEELHRDLVAFPSLDAAVAGYPGYRLNQPC